MIDGVGTVEEGDDALAFIKHGTATPTTGDGDEEFTGLSDNGNTSGKY